MDLALNDDQELIRETFASFFGNESSLELVRECEPLGFSSELWAKFSETGATGMGVDESRGGGGAGMLEMALVAEEYGRCLAPVPFLETSVCARLLAQLGDPAQALLEAAIDGNAIVTLALRPVGESPDQLIPAGAIAQHVIALDGEELVAISRAGDQETPCPRNHGDSPIATWPLRAEQIPGERVVLARGKDAVERFEAAREEWKVLTAAALVGLSAEALRIGAEYAKSRIQFGVPIGTYQAIAHPLADCATAVDGAQLLVWEAIWAADEGLPEAASLHSMAFTFAAETAAKTTAVSLHTHGGYGFSLEYDIQLYFRRAKAWALIWDDPRRELQTLADRLYGPAEA